MPIAQKQFPVRFTPRGLVDALDATDKFPGASIILSNLIFDQANPEIMVARPGVGSGITSFAGFATPGVVSVQTTIGDVTYGLISSTLNVGNDEPFAYNNATGAFIAVAGITGANTPVSPAAAGDWTPPTMAMVGVNLIVTHPGFPGGATKFGWFDLTIPAAPVWNAGDTTTNGLPSTPVAVANFFNRAYFACGNKLPYTDVLSLTRTSGTQALTIGDSSNITALSGLPLQTTSSGVVQALLVFKAFQCWQVTGDAATSDLAQNFLSLTSGCSAPRSIAQSPLGTYFISFSGPRFINLFGVLSDLTNSAQASTSDLLSPFQNAVVPSRIAGGYTGGIYRVCVQTTIRGVAATNDYWFHEDRRRWTGPHSFTYDCVSQYANYFILASNANPGKLFKSEIIPSSSSVYTDNGTAVTVTEQSSTFPKTDDMEMNQVVESTIELASAGGATSYSITALDDLGNTLNNCSVSVVPQGTLWGSGVWGGFSWASSVNLPTTYNVPWTAPLVFKKMAIYINATANAAIALGTFFARYKKAGYTNIR